MSGHYDLKCPYCDKPLDNEAVYPHVTYWGEDPPKLATCESCECVFVVKEHVTRTWETRKVRFELWDESHCCAELD